MSGPITGGHCLTEHFKGRARVLTSMIGVTAGFDAKAFPQGYPGHLKKVDFVGLWDTGATHSAITQKIVDALGLVQLSFIQMHGVHGVETVPTYSAALHLPSGVCFTSLVVSLGKIHGADILIGMDVIGAGDFAVTNHKGHTSMTLRTPSFECIDFVARLNKNPEVNPNSLPPPPSPPPPTRYPGTGRNDPCPCGSGKKYKNCCIDMKVA